MAKLPKDCIRIDDNTLIIQDVKVKNRIYANTNVAIENEAVEELKELLTVARTAKNMYAIKPEWFTCEPEVVGVSLSPDFHKGSGIPIGTSMLTRGMAVPQSVGGDINCGVRLLALSPDFNEIKPCLDELETVLRHIFFEGGRNIPLSQLQRHELILNGTANLQKETDDGIWKFFDEKQHQVDINFTRHRGGFSVSSADGLEDYLSRKDITRDSQIGSIGGGNHFVELQYVDRIINPSTAYAYGIKKNQLVLMIHSGSVSIGHICGTRYRDITRQLYQETGLKFPKNEIFPLPDGVPQYNQFWNMLHNAANFAFANRLFMGLMFKQALSKFIPIGVKMSCIYDTPHNLAWETTEGVLHRKGTSPAEGIDWFTALPAELQEQSPIVGEPVLIPGSMGSSSYLMEGMGNTQAFCSASHGAGRALSRGKALKYDESTFEKFLREFRIITPIDPKRHDLKGRKDIIKKYRESLKKEAPFAYKDVFPVVDTLRDAKIASPVAELRPILTLKGS